MDSPMIRVLKYLEAGHEIVAIGKTGRTFYRFDHRRGVIFAGQDDNFISIREWHQFGPMLSALAQLEQFLPPQQPSAPIEDTRMVEL